MNPYHVCIKCLGWVKTPTYKALYSRTWLQRAHGGAATARKQIKLRDERSVERKIMSKEQNESNKPLTAQSQSNDVQEEVKAVLDEFWRQLALCQADRGELWRKRGLSL